MKWILAEHKLHHDLSAIAAGLIGELSFNFSLRWQFTQIEGTLEVSLSSELFIESLRWLRPSSCGVEPVSHGRR